MKNISFHFLSWAALLSTIHTPPFAAASAVDFASVTRSEHEGGTLFASMLSNFAKQRILASDENSANTYEHHERSDIHVDSETDSMVVHVVYEDIYAILLFILMATVMGKLASKLGMPSLVGEIVAGFLFGPPLADIVPFPEALVLIGEIGLIVLLLEAGIELDIAQLRETGTRALCIGITGTLLPLAVGFIIASIQGSSSFKAAMAVGASFSPTSLGVAASALKSGKMVDTPVGQLIVAACVVDDILALILLSLFQVLVNESPSIVEYFIPITSSFGFLIVLGGLAITVMPKIINEHILKRVPEAQRELILFGIMGLMLSIYLPLMYYTKASYLMGAFLTGCSFSLVDGAHHTFTHNMSGVMTWLLRIFFAASIGFQVPVKLYFDPYVVAWGFILYLCVIAKLPLGLFVPQFEDSREGQTYNPVLRDRLIAGLSMTCRGEMSFIIAAFALGEGLITSEVYGSITLAVLLSCITSPFLLLYLIKYYKTKQKEFLASTNPLKLSNKEVAMKSSPLYLHVKIHSPTSWGMQEKYRHILNDIGLEIIERRSNRDGRGLAAHVTSDLFVRDTTMTIRLERMRDHSEIKVTSSNEKLTQLEQAASKDDAVVSRCRQIESIIESLFGKETTVGVIVYNPFPRELSSTDLNSQLDEACKPTADESFFYTKVFDKMDKASESEREAGDYSRII